MAPTAWQLVSRLDAWRVTQIPRRPQRQQPGELEDYGDLLAGQRAAALGAAYHGGAGPVGFAWVRDRAGGPVHVLAAGRGLAAIGDAQVVLKLPAGGRGEAIGSGGLAQVLAGLPCWVRIAGVADSLLAAEDAEHARAVRPSLEDGLLAAWPGAFGWLVFAEPVSRQELEELTFQVYAAQGAAQRFDNPQAQLSVQRLQGRHAELRQTALTGLWRVYVLAGAMSGMDAAEVAALLCASADLGGLPYELAPTQEYGSLDSILDGDVTRSHEPRSFELPATREPSWPSQPSGDLAVVDRPRHGQGGWGQVSPPSPQPMAVRPRGAEQNDQPVPASPFFGSSAVLAALVRPPAREIPGSARFVLRPEFDTIPEVAAGGIRVGELLDRNRMPAGLLALPRSSLNRHAFVSGATGAGKSQTVRSLLEQATVAGIPWLVIEPAKAEYSGGMAARLPGTEVIRIRPGEAEQAAAGINPLEPAVWSDGTRFPLQTHADLVKSLFLAAFEADEPFPQVLNAALTRVYGEHGWDLVLGEPATPGVCPAYPALGICRRPRTWWCARPPTGLRWSGTCGDSSLSGWAACGWARPAGSSKAATSWTSGSCWTVTWCSRSRTSATTRTRRS